MATLIGVYSVANLETGVAYSGADGNAAVCAAKALSADVGRQDTSSSSESASFALGVSAQQKDGKG